MISRYAYIYPNDPHTKYMIYEHGNEWIVIEEKKDGSTRKIDAGMPFTKIPKMDDLKQFIK